MSLATDIEELVDETTLQDLDFTPPCELDGVHHQRRIPVAPAELVVVVLPPCRCEPAETLLICTGCDEFLKGVGLGRCTVCGCHALWCHVVIDRRPL